MLKEDELQNAVLLVLANKQDLPNAVSVAAITEALKLRSLPPTRKWSIQSCCATTGDGLYEGFDSLSTDIAEQLAMTRKQPSTVIVASTTPVSQLATVFSKADAPHIDKPVVPQLETIDVTTNPAV